MIPRYSRPEMARIWSEQNRFQAWLDVEIAATEVLAERGTVPKEALAAIKERARFDVARIDAIEKEVQHDVIAFVSNVAENVGPEGRWLHYGLTSSDVVDTALSVLMRDACDLILTDVDALMAASASWGTVPRSASTSVAAISTSSHAWNRFCSDQMQAISGRE